jgi:DNA replication initiation complex subunit (GINS family)
MATSTTTNSFEALERLVEKIFISRTITKAEQAELMDLVMEDGKVTPEEQKLIDKVWKGLHEGRLHVID